MTDQALNDAGRRWRIVGFGAGVKVVPRDAPTAAGGVTAAVGDPGTLVSPVTQAADATEPPRAATA